METRRGQTPCAKQAQPTPVSNPASPRASVTNLRAPRDFCGQGRQSCSAVLTSGCCSRSPCLCWHIQSLAQGTAPALLQLFLHQPRWQLSSNKSWQVGDTLGAGLSWNAVGNKSSQKGPWSSSSRSFGAVSAHTWIFGTISVFMFGILDLCLLCLGVNIASVSWGKCENIPFSTSLLLHFLSFLNFRGEKPNYKHFSSTSFFFLFEFSGGNPITNTIPFFSCTGSVCTERGVRVPSVLTEHSHLNVLPFPPSCNLCCFFWFLLPITSLLCCSVFQTPATWSWAVYLP